MVLTLVGLHRQKASTNSTIWIFCFYSSHRKMMYYPSMLLHGKNTPGAIWAWGAEGISERNICFSWPYFPWKALSKKIYGVYVCVHFHFPFRQFSSALRNIPTAREGFVLHSHWFGKVRCQISDSYLGSLHSQWTISKC